MNTKKQEAFVEILNCLSAQEPDPKKILEIKIAQNVMMINSGCEQFWEVVSANKNIFSYKFMHRCFPTFNEDEEIKVVNAVRVHEPRVDAQTYHARLEEKRKLIKEQYDLRDGLLQLLNADYADEACKNLHILPIINYSRIVSYDVVYEIFTLMHKYDLKSSLLLLFCTMLVDHDMFHLVLNANILHIMHDAQLFCGETMEIIHHAMFYAMHIAYREECMARTSTSLKHRFVFDLETASLLPQFNGALHNNPYVPISLSKTYMYASNVPADKYIIKPMRAPDSLSTASTGTWGLYSYAEFVERFNIFTDGIFADIPMDRLWFGGSVITACVVKNPLEKLFCTVSEYFDEYYPSKKCVNMKTCREEDYTALEDELSDIDIMVDLYNDKLFDRYALNIFEHIRKKCGNINLIKINTKKSYKYYVSGEINRSIEIFRMYGTHPIGGVSRFHFPAVRGAFNRSQVFIMPSLIAYAMSGIFIDYKWMSSMHSTQKLVLKYYMRGGTLLLNDKEHEYVAAYIAENLDEWGILIKYAESGRTRSIMNPVFRPRLYRSGFYRSIEKYAQIIVPNKNEFIEESHSEADDIPKSKFNINLELRYPSGHIKPFVMWKLQPYVAALKSY